MKVACGPYSQHHLDREEEGNHPVQNIERLLISMRNTIERG